MADADAAPGPGRAPRFGALAAAVALLASAPAWLDGASLWAANGVLGALALRLGFGHARAAVAWQRRAAAQRQAEQALRQAAMVFDNTRDGVVITDPTARIQRVNAAFRAITGFSDDEVVGQTPAMLKSGRQDEHFYRTLWRSLLQHGAWQGEIWNRRKNGEVYPEWLTISAVCDDAGRATHYVGVFTDVSRIRRGEAALERLAHHDPLTDLPNRRLLQSRLDHAIERGRRRGAAFAVLYIDLDGFKAINDSLGHAAGDELLVAAAARLKARLREEDTLGRLGGDEFVAVLEPVADRDAAALVARDLIAAINAPARLAGRDAVQVGASIGIALHPGDGKTAHELLRNADAAMYRAKHEGRNRLCFYSADLNADAVDRLEREAALQRAIDGSELCLHYQPMFDARGGRVVGAEALVRWPRDGALVDAAAFVPLAEHSGLAVALDRWVIDRVCAQLRAWRDAGVALAPVAVNVSARQFAAGDLDAVLRAALERHGIESRWIEVELAAANAIERPDFCVELLARLRALGVRVSLDRFGSRLTDVDALQHGAVDAVKVDRSFVQRIGAADGSTVFDALVVLAQRLRLRVVAAGVESDAQAAHVARLGCDAMQGFLLGRPMAADAFAALLAAQRA